jgi:hypothetical protein
MKTFIILFVVGSLFAMVGVALAVFTRYSSVIYVSSSGNGWTQTVLSGALQGFVVGVLVLIVAFPFYRKNGNKGSHKDTTDLTEQ